VTSLVECEGTPRDLGRAQGRACREALRAHCRSSGWWARFTAALPAPRAAAPRALCDMRRHFPHQAEQLEGIARGAGLPLPGVGCVMLEALAGASHGPSLALARGGAALVARSTPVDALLRRTRPEGRLRSVELTLTPLTTALLGVNELGLTLACDAGPLEAGTCAAPAALLARDCLERFAEVEAALEWCMHRPAARCAAILMADAHGRVAGVQIAHASRRALRPESGLLLVREGSRVDAKPLEALGAGGLDVPDLPDGLAAAFGPHAAPLAWADPVGRRIRTLGPDAAWVGV
jgi:hypothetical protein